jgi:prepilin-type N-terminal cleavage/methylation domain-containing protein
MKNKGFTLIELLVAIGLFTIMIAIAVGAFISAIRAQRVAQGFLAAQSNVNLTVEQMAREIRTGYLFCHDPGSYLPNGVCGCTVFPSAFPSNAPGAISTPGNPQPVLPIWNCVALSFINAEGNTVTYQAPNGILQKGVNGVFQDVTGDNVIMRYLGFTLFGNTEGDNWTPRITLDMSVAASGTDPALMLNLFNLQTTISARTIDCSNTGGVVSC